MAKMSPDKIESLVRKGLAFLLCVFLIGFSSLILRDSGSVSQIAPQSSPVQQALSAQMADLQKQLNEVSASRNQITAQKSKLFAALNVQGQSFHDQVMAKGMTNPQEAEKAVVSQLQTSQEMRRQILSLIEEEAAAASQMRNISQKLASTREDLNKINQELGAQRAEQEKTRQLRIFILRLAFVLPVLGLGVFLIAKYRNHKNSPLVWGYFWFSLYAFFFGLVPYLPSFGGYVRYGIGVLLVVVGGSKLLRYMERKAEERRQNILNERDVPVDKVQDFDKLTVAKQQHICPMCNKDWQVTSGETQPAHCPVCGVSLFDTCSCGTKSFSFFHYCGGCGVKKDKK